VLGDLSGGGLGVARSQRREGFAGRCPGRAWPLPSGPRGRRRPPRGPLVTASESLGRRCAQLASIRSRPHARPRRVHGALAFWMQTSGVCQVGTTTAARSRCPRLYMRAVVRPCCCTSCCTDLALTRQVNSVRLPLVTLAQLALLSRPKRSHDVWPAKATARPILGSTVRRCPSASTAVGSDCYSHGYPHARESASLADITYQRAWRFLRTSKRQSTRGLK
jgi:hypothetical protein